MQTIFKLEELQINIAADLFKATSRSPTNPFQPIGIGKPLVIRLHGAYTGELSSIWASKQDILVASAIKNDTTFAAASLAIHQVFDKRRKYELLHPAASNEGTELIYYSKALDENRLLVDLKLLADSFDERVIDDIGNTLTLAGGLPIFLPAMPYLIAGGQLLRSAGSILNRILERVPLLQYTFDVSQDIAGLENTVSGFRIGINPFHREELKGYEVTRAPGLSNQFYLAKNGQAYKGSAPYIIISLDGSSVDRYEGFKATLASADLLRRFAGESPDSNLSDVRKMLEVYNDFKYLKALDKAEKKLSKTTDQEEKERIQKKIDAYRKNISNPEIFLPDTQ
ncbi:MAG: hypothetical protein AAFO03_21640 [Bacteroidota bacterium]